MPDSYTLLTSGHPHVRYHFTVGLCDTCHLSCIELFLNKLTPMHALPPSLSGSSARMFDDLSLLLVHLSCANEQVLGKGYRLIH